MKKQRPRKGSPRLSTPARVVVKEVSSGSTVKAAGQKAFPKMKPESARTAASRLLRKDTVQSALLAAYEKQGLTEEYLALKTKELCEASDTVTVGGIVIKGATEPNWTARGKGIEIAHKCRGDMKEKIEVEGLAEAVKKMADDQLNEMIVELLGKMRK